MKLEKSKENTLYNERNESHSYVPDHHRVETRKEDSLGQADARPVDDEEPDVAGAEAGRDECEDHADEGGDAEDALRPQHLGQATAGNLQEDVAVVERALHQALLSLRPAKDLLTGGRIRNDTESIVIVINIISKLNVL